MSEIHASFEVKDWQEDEFATAKGGGKLTRAGVKKAYTGDIEATSVTEWLMAYADDGTATFVGLERITGSVGGRSGTFVLQHVGTFSDGAAVAQLTVVAGAGSGDLADVSGTGDFKADPSGTLSLSLN